MKAIRDILELNGAKVHRIVERIPIGSYRRSEAGIPDLLCWFYRQHTTAGGGGLRIPHVFFVEVKAPGKIPSRKQFEWLRAAHEDGVTALWADSVEMLADEVFKEMGVRLRGLS